MKTKDQPFVLPVNPEDAVVRLKITVEAGEGNTLKYSATLFPGSLVCSTESIAKVFLNAGVTLVPGTYVLEMGHAFTGVTQPEDGKPADQQALIVVANGLLREIREDLVESLREFPSTEFIEKVAGRLIRGATSKDIWDRQQLQQAVVVDVRTMIVEAMDTEDLLSEGFIKELAYTLNNRRPRTCSNVQLKVVERAGTEVIQVGYFKNPPFADVLNRELARRVGEAVQVVALEVATQMMVQVERELRTFNRVKGCLLETYDVDMDEVARRVEALEVSAQEEQVQDQTRDARPPRIDFVSPKPVVERESVVHEPTKTLDPTELRRLEREARRKGFATSD